jgi:biotin carboxyl carrier protein
MKMLNTVAALESGAVKSVNIAVGMMITKGQLLIEFQ